MPEVVKARMSYAFPVLRAIRTVLQLFDEENKYLLYETMVKNDPEIYNALKMLSLMVAKAFRGFKVNDPDIERELRKIEKRLNFSNLIADTAFWLLAFGDVVFRIEGDTHNNIKFEMLPMYRLTILESLEQGKSAPMTAIKERNYYILNEGYSEYEKVFRTDEVVHISLNEEGNRTKDIAGRETFNI